MSICLQVHEKNARPTALPLINETKKIHKQRFICHENCLLLFIHHYKTILFNPMIFFLAPPFFFNNRLNFCHDFAFVIQAN